MDKNMQEIKRDRVTVACHPHKVKIEGAIPSPATKEAVTKRPLFWLQKEVLLGDISSSPDIASELYFDHKAVPLGNGSENMANGVDHLCR